MNSAPMAMNGAIKIIPIIIAEARLYHKMLSIISN